MGHVEALQLIRWCRLGCFCAGVDCASLCWETGLESQMISARFVGWVTVVLFLGGCASQWKIHGGPRECTAMCESWGMDLSGMVGVGNQDATGPGATACVCQVRRAGATAPPTQVGSSGAAAGVSAIIVALQEEEARRQQRVGPVMHLARGDAHR